MAFRVKENGAEVARRLERVVLGRDAAVEVLVKEGNLAQDVVAHTGHFTEEEEGEGASSNTEGGSNGSVLGGHVDAHTPEVGRNVVLGSERRAVGASRLGRSATESLQVDNSKVLCPSTSLRDL